MHWNLEIQNGRWQRQHQATVPADALGLETLLMSKVAAIYICSQFYFVTKSQQTSFGVDNFRLCTANFLQLAHRANLLNISVIQLSHIL